MSKTRSQVIDEAVKVVVACWNHYADDDCCIDSNNALMTDLNIALDNALPIAIKITDEYHHQDAQDTQKSQFEVVFELKTVGVYDSYREAAKVLIDMVRDALGSKNGYPLQLLETACWVVSTAKGSLPEMFYDVRDKAIYKGWLVNGTGEWAVNDNVME